MTHHGKFRSDDPCETNWKSSDLLHDSTPYYNEQMNGNDPNHNNDDTPTNPSGFSPNYGDDNSNTQSQSKWDRSYSNKPDSYNQRSNSNFNGFKSGIHKRSDLDRNAFPPSFRNRFNYNRRGSGYRPRGRGGFRGGRGRGRGGYYRRGRGRGYPRYRSRGRGRGTYRGGPRRFKNNRKPTTKEDLDRDLEKYLYGGDDGQERKKTDLDNDLDSYWNDSNINSAKKVENDESENDKQEMDDEEEGSKGDKVESESTNKVKESETSGEIDEANGH